MQFHRGDASQCIGAVDGVYLTRELRIKTYRIAIRDYTFTIPVDNRLAANHNLTEQNKLVTDLIVKNSPCKVMQNFQKFPYAIVNETIVVTPIRKGQLLLLVFTKATLPPHFEFGQNIGGQYRVCYPADVAVDYIDR